MPTLKLDADARKGVKAFEDLDRAVKNTEKNLELTTREAKKLETQAGRIARQNEGPQERYNRKIQELATLVANGKIELDQAHIAAKRYGDRLDHLGQSGKEAFGPSMLSRVGGMATGILGAVSAASALSAAFQQVSADAQAAADRVVSSLGAIGELQQVSPDEQTFQKNLGYANSLVSKGVFSDTTQAVNFAIASQNAGHSDLDRAFLARVAGNRQVSADNLEGFASKLAASRALYEGKSLEFVGDRLLAASGFTQSPVSKLAEATSRIIAPGRDLNWNSDALLAGLAMSENAAGANIDVGSTQLSAFLRKVGKGGLNQGSLIGTLDAIQARVAAGESKYGVFGGDQTAVAGYDGLIANRQQLINAIGTIGGSSGAFDSREYISGDPNLRAAKTAAQSAGNLQVVQDQLTSRAKNLAQSAIDEMYAYQINSGHPYLGAGMNTITDKMADWGAGDFVISMAAQSTKLPLDRRLDYAQYLQDQQSPGSGDKWDRLVATLEAQLAVQQRMLGEQERESRRKQPPTHQQE